MRLRVTVGCVAATFALVGLRTPAAAQSKVHVCVGADQVLRFAVGACPAGQASYNLLEGAVPGGGPQPPGPDQTLLNQLNDAKKSIDFLRDRVSHLENELAKQKDMKDMQDEHVLTAPLQVVDKAGKPIFTVTDAAYGQATHGRVHIGRGSAGNYGIWVTNAGDGVVAAIGEAKVGGGAINVYDPGGTLRAELSGDGFQLKNPAGTDVVSLALQSGSTKGLITLIGLLQIVNETGVQMVAAGTDPKGAGVVRVGPRSSCVPMGMLRLPDCIMGHP